MAVVAGLLFLFGCSWMTLYAAFCWKSFLWSLLFCIIHCIGHMCLYSQFEPYSRKSEAAGCALVFGVLCTFLGVFMLLLPETGLSLFRIIFNIGVINTIGSILIVFLEKVFDQLMHSAVSAMRDTLSQNKTLVEALVAVLATFVCGLAAFLSPARKQRPQIDINAREIINSETEEEQLAERLDRIKDVGMKVTLFTGLFTVLDSLIVESGVIFWIIHALYADTINFAGLFSLGAGCTIAGVWLRNLPEFGLTPFVVGNLCIMFSTFYLKEPSAQLDRMFDNNRADSASLMIINFVLTQLTLFWWDSFVLATVFCVLFIVSTAWYCLSYVTFGRFIVKKALSIYFREPSDAPERQATSVRTYGNHHYQK